jgi:hypothetical protein
MKGLHVLVALFAAFMLVRHVPRAASLLRGQGPRAMGIVSFVNVVLALALLAVAVKGLL